VTLPHNALSTNIPSQLHKIKNLLSQLSVRACTHYVQALCFCFSNPFKKLAEKTQSQKKAVSNGNRLIHAKKLCTKTTFHTPHKSSQNNLPRPGIISHRPPPHFELSKTKKWLKKKLRKFSPKTAAKLPHPPMAFFVHKKNSFFAKLRKKINFSISSFFLSAQLVRAGPQHAQALTLCLNKKDQVVLKLCQKIEVLRQLPARDLGTQRALHEHSRTASHKQTFSLSAFSLSGLVHITYNPCVFVSSIHSKNSLRKLHHKKSR
jgi:hypothetical protein